MIDIPYHTTTKHVTQRWYFAWNQLWRAIAITSGNQWSSYQCSSWNGLGDFKRKTKVSNFANKIMIKKYILPIHCMIRITYINLLSITYDLMSWWISGGLPWCKNATPLYISFIMETLKLQTSGGFDDFGVKTHHKGLTKK